MKRLETHTPTHVSAELKAGVFGKLAACSDGSISADSVEWVIMCPA